MDTNASFVGRLVGNISGCSGYPEPIFMEWRTNMVFSYLTLSNLVVTPGVIQVRDLPGTARVEANNAGEIYLRNAGGITQTKTEPGTITLYTSLGGTASKLTGSAVTIYEPVSGQPITILDSYLALKTPAGILLASIDKYNGLSLYNEANPSFKSVDLNYLGFTLMNSSSQTVFSINNVSGKTLMQDTAITNSGNLTFHGPNGTNLLTLTGSTGAIKVRGQDSDQRYALAAPTNMVGFVLTNVFANVTNRLWFSAQGVLTNRSSP